MSNVLNRKMFVQGARRGRQVTNYGLPIGAGQVTGGNILGFDILGGYTKAKDIRQQGFLDPEGDYPFLGAGITQAFSTVPEYYKQGYNQVLAPFLDATKAGLSEVGAGFGLYSRGELERSGLADPAGRFKTVTNPYGLQVKPGLAGYSSENMQIAFDQEYPRGSQKRKDFIVSAAQEPGFSSKLALYGVSQTEISALNEDIIEAAGPADPKFTTETKDDFLRKPGSGYQAGQNNLVKLLQGEPFKDVETGDLKVMEDIVKARAASAAEDDVSEQTKENLQGDSTPPGEPGSDENISNYEQELLAELQDAEDQKQGFVLEDEVDRMKKLLSEQTDVKDTTTPALALLQLASNLMSGKTSEKGFAGFLDVLGQASGPVLDTAIKLSQAEKQRKQELGASAVALALEKEQDLIEAAQAQADRIADLNTKFDETQYVHKLLIGPNGEKLGYDTSSLPIPVNSMRQALPYLEAQPFIVETQDNKTRTVNLVGYEMLKTDAPGEFLPGLRDPDGFYKSGGPNQLLTEILKNMSVANSFKTDILADDESSFSLVGATYLLQNTAFKFSDIIDAFKNDKDLQQRLGDNFSLSEVERLQGELQRIENHADYRPEEKETMKTNLILEAAGFNYRNALVAKTEELFNDRINVGGQSYTLKELANMESGTLNNQEIVLAAPTSDIMTPSGNTVTLEGDEIIEAAKERVGTIINALDQSQIGYNLETGAYDIRPIDSFDDNPLTVNVFGKNLKISNKISQVQTYSTLLGFGFAQTIQPDQRLLKDTIEKSLANFAITDLTSGPKQVRGRVDAYMDLLEKSYNTIVANTFTDPYYERFKYFDGKRSITQHQGNNAIRFAGDPKNNNLNVNFNKKNNEINDSINSGQNFQQKDKYYEIGSLVEEFERDIAEAALR